MGDLCSCNFNPQSLLENNLSRENNNSTNISRPPETVLERHHTKSPRVHIKILSNDDIKNLQLVNIKFKKFFSSDFGKKLMTNIDKRFAVKLHKHLLKHLTKTRFKNNKEALEKNSQALYKSFLEVIADRNELIAKAELLNISSLYTKTGYKDYYENINQAVNETIITQLKPKEGFDRVIVINYQNNMNLSQKEDLHLFVSNAYKGQVNLKNIPHGYGIMTHKDSSKQKGYWRNGVFEGWNLSIDSEGTVLVGRFINGILNGYGDKMNAKTMIYSKCLFKNGLREGEGVEESPIGMYKGTFVNDMKEGKGVMYYTSGDVYEGEYKKDQLNGNGCYKWIATGYEYTGQFLNGEMHGKGEYRWNEKEYYKGEFKKGIREGQGDMHWENGRRYAGAFVNGNPHGIGLYENGSKVSVKMEFINGKMNKDYNNQ